MKASGKLFIRGSWPIHLARPPGWISLGWKWLEESGCVKTHTQRSWIHFTWENSATGTLYSGYACTDLLASNSWCYTSIVTLRCAAHCGCSGLLWDRYVLVTCEWLLAMQSLHTLRCHINYTATIEIRQEWLDCINDDCFGSNTIQRDRQCTCNVRMRCISIAIVAVNKQ